MKSLTGRTEVLASVGPKGEVDIKVTRNGMTVNTFSLPREDGIGANDTIEVNEGVVSVIDNSGPDGPRVKEVIRMDVPEAEAPAKPKASTSMTSRTGAASN